MTTATYQLNQDGSISLVIGGELSAGARPVYYIQSSDGTITMVNDDGNLPPGTRMLGFTVGSDGTVTITGLVIGLYTMTWAQWKSIVRDILSDGQRTDTTYTMAVAEYVSAQLRRKYDHDLDLYQSHWISYLGMRKRLLGYAFTGSDTDLQSAVLALLPVDNSRQGASAYISAAIQQAKSDIEGLSNSVEEYIRLGVIDIQSHIPLYRVGQNDIYQQDYLTRDGACSQGDMPEQCQVRDAYYMSKLCSIEAISMTNEGSGYTQAVGQIVGDGTGALVVPKMDGGRIIGWDILSKGEGYTTATISISGDGTGASAVVVLKGGCTPLTPFPWTNRKNLAHHHAAINSNNFLFCVDPYGTTFQVYPPIDAQHYLSIYWDGLKLTFSETDVVPFDEQMADAVADFVKGNLSRSDNSAYQSYLALGKGSYFTKRRRLLLDAADRQRMKDAP